MADIIDKQYTATLRYAADLRTALEGVVSAKHTLQESSQEMEDAMECADDVLYDLYHAEAEVGEVQDWSVPIGKTTTKENADE